MDPEHLFSSGRILLVAAHPDDESIGTGGHLHLWRDRTFVLHATDGAPLNPSFAHNAGFSAREDYAAARSKELRCALDQARIPIERRRTLGIADQDTVNNLPGLIQAIVSEIDSVQPAWVMTHSYEGGHPDHDSCAFACRMALAMAAAEAELWEFTSYHTSPGGIETGSFLGGQAGVITRRLDADQRDRKHRLFDCHQSQRTVLDWFRIDEEQFRPAPEYDFTKAPHQGRLQYETLDWGIDGARWRERAVEAMEKMGTHHVTYNS